MSPVVVAARPCPECNGRGFTRRKVSCNCGIGRHVFESKCVVCEGRGQRAQKCRRCSGRRWLAVRDPSSGDEYKIPCRACQGGPA
jgi:DnaJ-class molecular chaperone